MNRRFDKQIYKFLFTEPTMHMEEENIQKCIQNILNNFSCVKSVFLEILCVDKLEFIEFIDKQYSKSKNICFLKSLQQECLNYKKDDGYLSNLLDEMLCQLKVLAIKIIRLDYLNVAEKCWTIYLKKNSQYNDAWYTNGTFGIFYDLHRKMIRLQNIAVNMKSCCEKASDNELFDTIIDSINYCIFLRVTLSCGKVSLFSSAT